MSGEQRLDRVYPGLTARERGLLVLRAYKAHDQADAQIYDTTPWAQAEEFNLYIRMMNAVNTSCQNPMKGRSARCGCSSRKPRSRRRLVEPKLKRAKSKRWLGRPSGCVQRSPDRPGNVPAPALVTSKPA